LPFAKGVLSEPASLDLVDSAGRPVPLQTLPLARWADGSVKWLLLDFLLPGVREGCVNWLLRLSPNDRRVPEAEALRVKESLREVVIETGSATFHLDRRGQLPFTRVLLGEEDVLDAEGTGLFLTDAKGRRVTPKVERLSLEVGGPVRATVAVEGTFPGLARLRFRARFSFFAGTGLVRVSLTVHNPNRARHRGGLWDLGDPGSMLFRDLSLRLSRRGAGDPCVSWVAEFGQSPRSTEEDGLQIYQDSSGGENRQSRNHVNREGRVPCSFRGYRLRVGAKEEHGLRASPVLALRDAIGGLSVAVPEFWQQFPKALGSDGRSLRVGLFPEEFDDLFELQGGEQKTHLVWLNFDTGTSSNAIGLDWVHQPAHVHAPPEWYAASGAVLHLLPSPIHSPTALETFLSQAVDGPDSLLARREIIDEYGWRNYGEVYADHEAAYYTGPGPVVSHYNNQYDVVYGALLQYLRTADARWLDLFGPLARHVMDIDIYHTTQDKAAYNGGLFWHTDHYRDAATCTHRCYSRSNRQPGRPYGGGPCNEHNYTTGLLHYHYLTGNPDARAAVLELANWVVNMDDGSKTLLAPMDDGPTGLASATAQQDYHGPGRGSGNSINALIDAWLLTGDRTYRDKAEHLIRRCIHPLDDVDARDLLNVEMRWSYTVFLTTLARFLRVKAEADELDFMYAYGRASLLHYASWMLEHEVPYFDHPEKLAFPTETWAAQEFRKANVLRLAAAHAGEPLRSRLLGRADELAERGWKDLLRFDQPATARAIALSLVEMSRHQYLRVFGVAPAPRPPAEHDFGNPEPFVRQRLRVQRQLKSASGLVKALLRVLTLSRWPTSHRPMQRP
ncbi:MAG TPA: hypothetical protein VH682_08185, partial [Gemmataceae bacterium]